MWENILRNTYEGKPFSVKLETVTLLRNKLFTFVFQGFPYPSRYRQYF